MTREQIDALIAYIDAAIEEAQDTGSSFDGGLTTVIAKRAAEDTLREVLEENDE